MQETKVFDTNGRDFFFSSARLQKKTLSSNPRSTVGTLTDIYDYLRVLFSITGQAHCPYCQRPIPIKTAVQIVEHLLSLPTGTTVEIAAPIEKIYGEEYAYLFADIRSKGYRHVRIDGKLYDISEEIELDEGREYEILAIVSRSRRPALLRHQGREGDDHAARRRDER